jgi:hypothetical protein
MECSPVVVISAAQQYKKKYLYFAYYLVYVIVWVLLEREPFSPTSSHSKAIVDRQSEEMPGDRS